MSTKQIIQRSFLNTLGVAVYVFVVASIMTNASHIFGKMPGLVGPFAFLMLFVLSATITGMLVFLKPILLYVEGEKKSAVTMIMYTVMWMAVFTVITLASLAIFK